MNSSSTLSTFLVASTTPLKQYSNFEKFCGYSPFWDNNLLLKSAYPKFTECFQVVGVTWIPCILYIVLCIPYLPYIINRRWTYPPKLGALVIIKTICTVLLLGVTIATIIKRAIDSNSSVSNAFYVAETLKIVTFVLYIILGCIERRRAIHASYLSWFFWLFLATFNVIPFYTVFEEVKQTSAPFEFAITIVFTLLVWSQLIIASFAEPIEETQKRITELGKFPCPELKVSVPNQLLFWWVNSLVFLGFKKPLEEEDIFDLNPADKCVNLMPSFMAAWKKAKKKADMKAEKTKPITKRVADDSIKLDEKSPLIRQGSKFSRNEEKEPKRKGASVFWVLMSEHGFLLFLGMFLKAAFDAFNFLTPKITESLMDYVQNRGAYHPWRGYILVFSFFVVKFICAVGSTQALYFTKRAAIRMKSTLINSVYKKSMTVSGLGDDQTRGQIVNLMSVDCQRIEDSSNYMYMLLSDPVTIIIALYLLYVYMGISAFAGIAVMVCTIPLNTLIGKFFQKFQHKQMMLKDERIKLLTEVLNGIKVLKLYAWELSFQKKILNIRNKELKVLRNIRLIMAILMYLFAVIPSLVQVTAFATFVALNGYLSPTVAFISLQLFNLLRAPLSFLPMLINSLIQTKVSFDRISDYLNRPDIKEDVVRYDESAVNAVEIKDGTFTWSMQSHLPTLNKINVEIKPGSLVAVVGAVGSGKSSLISAILGEMEKLSGTVTVNSSVAYVPQEAWIQNETLRNNILFGKEYNQRKYNKVIDACALKADIGILTGGDQTEIGEKGINISGGQKQRVSVARAVYSDNDIYLFDDPLSAVDSHVGKHMFSEVIGKDGLLRKKTRVLVTHGVQWLPLVDKIFVMTNGQISESGTYTELMERGGNFAAFLSEFGNKDPEDRENAYKVHEDFVSSSMSNTSTESNRSVRSRRRKVESSFQNSSLNWGLNSLGSGEFTFSNNGLYMRESVAEVAENKDVGKLTEVETSLTGTVKFGIYIYYFKQIGLWVCALSIFLYMCYAGNSVFTAIWLTKWTGNTYLSNTTNLDTTRYSSLTKWFLGIFVTSSLIQGLFILVFSILAAIKLIQAAGKIHLNMLGNVFRSPMSFFDTTPIGRITNRFSRDVDVVDVILPMNMRQILTIMGNVFVTIINISYGTPVFLAAMIPIGAMYIGIQMFYIPAYRQLRRVVSVTRSPIYTHFSETLNGVASIRAYKSQKRFMDESVHRVDYNMKYYYASVVSNTWLSLRLQIIGTLIIVSAAIFAVVATNVNSSVVGLSIAYASTTTMALQLLVNSISECESNIVSVERIKEYTNTPQEAAWDSMHKADDSWPDKGDIVMDHYETRYRPGLDLVLKDVNCTIKGGEKIGIVGRTGAGKSSMTVALFRIIEPASGTIVIDGEDITQLGLHQLRDKLTILPQDPMLFSGSMRMNLDPFNKFTEYKIWNALEQSYLKNFVEQLPGGLEYECGEDGQNLSVGQRQLVCLARTLLRKTKILVLDEATAAVDMETDDLIQKTIRQEFKDCTILTIAHRLNTIMDYDRVMVLDQGSIKEFDSPAVLLADSESTFHGMAKDAGLV